ncbi:MAG: hypothetical protein JXA90_16325 [Planctomycetes bacterium]|nr:hypothetical protein [Planctomycetota bacterium]
MHHFDLYLESPEDTPVEAPALLGALASCPLLRATVGDPTRLVYRNEDTSVHFTCILDRALLLARLRTSSSGGAESDDEAEDGDEDADGERRAWRSVLPDEDELADDGGPDEDEAGARGTRGADLRRRKAKDEGEDEGDGEDADEEEGDEEPIESPLVTFSVPLFRPSFFLKELWILLAAAREASGLLIVDPQEGGAGGGEPGDWSEADIARSWAETHRRAIRELEDPGALQALQVWSPQKCSEFFDYGTARGALAARLEPEGIAVPRLQPARHGGRTKSLCFWNSRQSSVLPPCDLVLLERQRIKRGLLGTRLVSEEVIVSGEDVWNLLAPAAEYHTKPATFLAVPDADSLPSRVLEALDELPGEPAASARRTELAGVIDFDPDALENEESSA